MVATVAWQHVLDHALEEDARLILQLQLADVEEIYSASEPAAAGDDSPDREIARRLYELELKQYSLIRQFEVEETRLAEASVAAACDAPLITTDPVVVQTAPQQEAEPGLDFKPDIDDKADRTNPLVVPLFTCVSCSNQVSIERIWQAPCRDYYCTNCLEELVRLAMMDETLFPPRCCRIPMPIEDLKLEISAQLATQFEAKREELETKDRTYCHVSTCSAFISMANIAGEVAQCHRCEENTCTICKGKAHEGDCPQDEGIQQVLRLASEQGWQRCRTCHSVVELTIGCNHIRCKCSAEFCYVCGETWKTCPCEVWDEVRLLTHDEQVARGGVAGAAAQRDRIAEEIRHLRERHLCGHANWERVAGRGDCEECNDTLPRFLLRCEQCHMRACQRCAYNRLGGVRQQ